jgi:hypothetical protein
MNVFALHTISSLPLDPHFPLFAHYPAMKLGVRESVRFYAELLAPVAAEIMSSQPETMQWTVTAPPLHALPSGANLMAWEVCRILNENSVRPDSVRAVDLRYAQLQARDLSGGAEYSSWGIEARIANRQRLLEGESAPRPDPADFRDRAVLVINDINVTGTQQRFLQRILETVGPASIHWLYVTEVDAALSRSNPELEYSLNHLHLGTFEDFVDVVARADVDYTTRCISRLFTYSEANLEQLLGSLDETRRRRLQQLVSEEGAYTGDEFETKVALLQEWGRVAAVR